MKSNNKKKNRKKVLAILKAIISLVLMILVFRKSIDLYKAGILTDRDRMEDFLGKNVKFAPFAFVILRVVISFIPFIPNTIASLVGFVMFGILKGSILNFFSSIVTSFLDYYLTEKLGMKFVTKIVSEEAWDKYSKFVKKSQETFNKIYFRSITIPFAPGNVMSMVSATTNIKKRDFSLIVVIGNLINTLITAFALNYIGKFALILTK